jgi:hypothetical protein
MILTDNVTRPTEFYHDMSGQDRLEIAQNLHALACDQARELIRREFPNADEAEVEQQLHLQLQTRQPRPK